MRWTPIPLYLITACGKLKTGSGTPLVSFSKLGEVIFQRLAPKNFEQLSKKSKVS